ncbi:MAG: radical SAM protein [Firmicutes bacterium]|nr:radical SAM protein [Dethiobacter sp.]MBS3888798.1 radical SAM protein [Bacillota bacterium]MBS4054687.1 radical SAM protein [Thermaerobacter sp.]
MIFVTRKDGSVAGMDVFNRRYSVGFSKSDVKTNLKEQGVMFKSYREYLEYIKSIDYIQTIYYNLTHVCGLSCPYCYAPKDGKFVTLSMNRQITDRLVELSVRNIVLVGGEPFNHPDLRKIIQRLHSVGLQSISILTNGIAISDDLLCLIDELDIEIQISLDGYNEETNAQTRGEGNFARVMNTISRLEAIGAEFSVMNTLTANNIAHAKCFVDFFNSREINFGFFVVKKVKDELRPKIEHLLALYHYLLSLGYSAANVFDCVKSSEQMKLQETGFPITHCGAGITDFVLTPNADVYPCLKMLDDDKQVICNLLDNDSIDRIKRNRDKAICSDLVDNLPRCAKCKIRYICGGSCRADQSFISNNHHSYSQCQLQKANIKFFLENTGK